MNACHLNRLLVVLLLISPCIFAQKPILLRDALQKVTQESGTQFIYEKQLFDGKTTTYRLDNLSNKPVEEVLKSLLLPNKLFFLYVKPNLYSILPKDTVSTENPDESYQRPGNQSAISGNTSFTTYIDRIMVTGIVTDDNGKGIPDATVSERGYTNSTITGTDGHFALSVNSTKSVLLVSSVGYETKEITVGTGNNFAISLSTKTAALEDVVVVGYGVQKKKLITGATSQVKGTDIERQNTTAVLDALKGQVAGLSITKVSAQPGDGFKVNIRGIGTTGNSSPLFVVDGVPVPNINNLNPSDVESFDVLKDAASAAIYGSRASNGVILITTKKGRVGKATISYDGFYGIQNVAKKLDYVGAKDYLMLWAEDYKNKGIAVPDFSKLIPSYDNVINGNGTNWLDATSNKNAPIQSHSINITGGTEQSIYSLGLSLDDQNGIVGKPATPTYKRLSFRMNSSAWVSNFL